MMHLVILFYQAQLCKCTKLLSIRIPETEELSWPSYFFLNPRLYKPFLKVIIKQSMCHLDCRAMIKCTCYSVPYLLEVHISPSCFEKLHPLIFSFLYRLFCFIKWRLYINAVIFELKSASWQSCTYDKPAYIKICPTCLFTRLPSAKERTKGGNLETCHYIYTKFYT